MRSENQIGAYFQIILDTLSMVIDLQQEVMEEAANLIYNALCQKHYLYAFGTGHGHMLAEEIFYRAGGLARVIPLFDEKLMLHVCAHESTRYERQADYLGQFLPVLPFVAGDILLIFSNSGRNALTVELAIKAHDRGVKVIALTSLRHSSGVDSRHRSGKKLYEVADLVLDNSGEIGDAAIKVGERWVSPTSTVIGATMLEAIVARVVGLDEISQTPHKLCSPKEAGQRIETFVSSNVDGGDEINDELITKYSDQIPFI